MEGIHRPVLNLSIMKVMEELWSYFGGCGLCYLIVLCCVVLTVSDNPILVSGLG